MRSIELGASGMSDLLQRRCAAHGVAPVFPEVSRHVIPRLGQPLPSALWHPLAWRYPLLRAAHRHMRIASENRKPRRCRKVHRAFVHHPTMPQREGAGLTHDRCELGRDARVVLINGPVSRQNVIISSQCCRTGLDLEKQIDVETVS